MLVSFSYLKTSFQHKCTIYNFSGGIHIRIPGKHLDNVDNPYVKVVPWKTSDDKIGAKLPCTILKGPNGAKYLEFITLPFDLGMSEFAYCE